MEQLTTIEQIITNTSKVLGVDVEQIKSKSRKPELVQCRQIICKLGREKTSLSLKKIGNEIGGRDHATVIHNLESFEADYEYNHRGLKDKFHGVCLVLEGVE